MRISIALAALVLAATAASVFGSTAPGVDPTGGLRISALLSSSEASGILRLVAPSEPTDVILTAGPLTWSAPEGAGGPRSAALTGVDLDRSAVTFDPKATTLQPGRPTDIRVTVKGFKFSGVYSGAMTINYIALPTPSPASSPTTTPPPTSTSSDDPVPVQLESRTVDLTVVVSDPSSVGLLSATAPIKIAKTTCGVAVECWIASWFVAPIELENKFRIDVRNQGQDDVTLGEPRFSFVGRQSKGVAIAPNAVEVELPMPISGGQIGSLQVNVDRALVSPDTYDGALTFTTTRASARTSIGLVLQVRRGPFELLFWILIGIAATLIAAKIGRWAQEHADAKSGFAAVEQVFDVGHPGDQADVAVRFERLKASARDFTWGDAQRLVSKEIISDLDSLRIVRDIEGRISDSGFTKTRNKIDLVRESVRLGKPDSAAKAALEAISAYSEEIPEPASPISEYFLQNVAYLQVGGYQDLTPRRLAGPLVFKLPTLPPVVQDRVVRGAWVIVRFGSLIVFVLAGLRLAYVDSSATFTGTYGRTSFRSLHMEWAPTPSPVTSAAS